MKLFRILLLSLPLLLLSSNCFAVYEYNVTVNKTGEDYNTVTLAEGALDNAGDIRHTGSVKCGAWDSCSAGTCDATNITDGEAVTWDSGVSSGTIHHLTSTEYIITASVGTLDDNDSVTDGTNTFVINGAGDSCQVTVDVYNDDGTLTDTWTFDGFTTDSDNFFKVTSPVGERHSGTAASGARISSNGANGIVVADNYSELSWLILDSSLNSAGNPEGLIKPQSGADNSVIKNNIIADCVNDGAGSFTNCIGAATQTFTGFNVYNNIIYNPETNGVGWGFGNGGVVVINNTIYGAGNNGFNIAHSNSTVTARNNAVFGSTGSDYSANIDTRQTNASEDTTGDAGLQSFVTAEQFTSTTGGSEDFHLITGADLIDAGTDLTTTANIDIDNYDRDAGGVTWDIGADEFIAVPVGGWGTSDSFWNDAYIF